MSFLMAGCSSSANEAETAVETEVAVESEVETETPASVVEIPEVLGEYNYISPEDVVAHIDAGDIESGAMLMVSAQTEEELAKTHMKGKLITNYSRPLETVEDFAKLESSYEIISSTDVPVIVICPGGKSGATRQYDYYVAKGIDPSRLMILENGQNNFSKLYPDYVESGEVK